MNGRRAAKAAVQNPAYRPTGMVEAPPSDKGGGAALRGLQDEVVVREVGQLDALEDQLIGTAEVDDQPWALR